MASSSLSAVEVFMGEERAVRIEGPVKSRDKGPPPMAKALQMAVILTVSEGWRGSPHWSPEQGRGWDQQGQWTTKLWLVGHGLRKFQIIIDCGQRGVSMRRELKVAGATVAWNLMKAMSEVRSQASKAMEASVTSA